jgi:hypothetical protein
MAKVPDRQDLVPSHGGDEGVDIAEIVAATAKVHHRPGNAFAGDCDAERPEHRIILVGMFAVLRLLAKIAAALVLPEKGRAFESGEEEGREDARFLVHPIYTRRY